jgi:hypothetical protein
MIGNGCRFKVKMADGELENILISGSERPYFTAWPQVGSKTK